MYIIGIVFLVAITIILYQIFKKISNLLALLENERKYVQDYGEHNNSLGIKDWLYLIFRNMSANGDNLQNIDYALNCENPAGEQSARSKRSHNLKKLYAEYLIKNDHLSHYEAETKASFEFAKFNKEEMIKVINGTTSKNYREKFDKEKIIEQTFFDTGLIEKDCIAQSQALIPHDIFAPIWYLFRMEKPSPKVEHVIKMAVEDSYSDYVKNRAIALKLLSLGIIAKMKTETPDKYWLLDPHFQFRINNLDEIRSIVYMGGSSHDDEYFEEKFNAGTIPKIFQPDFYYDLRKPKG